MIEMVNKKYALYLFFELFRLIVTAAQTIQAVITCSKLTTETLEQGGVKHVQS